jgi:DNA polymerase-1
VVVSGFGGDTMHLARLEHADRDYYSLEYLGETILGREWKKTALKEIMKKEKAKGVRDLHLSEKRHVWDTWVDYSTFDTVATWKLHERLVDLLRDTPWEPPDGFRNGQEGKAHNMLDFYDQYWLPLGDLLASIEARGIPVDIAALKSGEEKAEEDMKMCFKNLRQWIGEEYEKRYPDCPLLEGAAEKLLISSPKQVQHFLFGTGVSMVSDTPVGGLGIPPGGIERTPSGAYSVGGDIIDKLCGKNPESGEKGCGTAFGHLGQDGCIGLSNYSKAKDIGKQVGAFLLPLQKHGASGRVHTSLNLKTTTGRLVSSNPNLQQLPALDKDVYKVREAVRAPEGKKFIIADYGQLDLRVLAHMSRSKNMIEALCGGLDIHSATALNMYDYVKEALDNGDVCLEKQADKPDVPLLKDVYGSERRNAKAVNFGIAYGLTKFGLARQLDCSQEDAEYMIEKWYAAYPEALQPSRERKELSLILRAYATSADPL